jgi:CRISPR-associated endonuclease/helicase Cas3
MQARFWAKTGKGEFKADGQPYYHPVICHLADTASVAKEIVRTYLSQAAIDTLGRGLGLSGENLIRCCGFFAGSHDLGKVSPAFQYQRSEVAKVLASSTQVYESFYKVINDNHNIKTPHGLVTAKTLPEFLIEIGMKGKIARKLAIIVGGHHGFFPSGNEIDGLNDYLAGVSEGSIWLQYSHHIFEELREFVGLTTNDLPKQCDNAAVMILAGLTTVSDWIASNPDEKYGFPYANDKSFEKYKEDLPKKAREALRAIGWTELPTGNPIEFTKLFKVTEPRELQHKAIEVAKTLTTPCLMLLEASMGEGKTEAAIYLADYLQQQHGTGGFYIGLPTQATSNAMFERVREFLNTRYPEGEFPGLINLTLSHSAAELKEDYLKSICRLDKEEQIYDVDRRVVAQEWHKARKRTMLSPYGVGTVDQALMGAIRSKHQFVRLFGLAGRVVILDEIHAYDLYTSTLLERFLEWLALLGSPVIALSATLPVDTRRRLVNAYAKGCDCKELELPVGEYPRLTTFMQSGVTVDSFPASTHVARSLNLRWVNDQDWVIKLKEKLVDGGCVGVICSTVARAQEVFKRLQGQFTKNELGTELGLFHGRFLFVDRERIEKDCLSKFGKPGKGVIRPKKPYILVATQVIEQSLDLDFDLIISDLAPIDLLLQRSGRLHRHPDRKSRPENLTEPTIWLIAPEINDDGKPDFGVSEYIYDRHVLLRTWLTTRNLERVKLPQMMDELIESVYDLSLTPYGDLEEIHTQDWHNSLDKYNNACKVLETRAQQVHLPPAQGRNSDPDQFTCEIVNDDDDTVAAVTRLGEKSITTIFLKQTSTELALPSGGAINLKATPDLNTVRSLLGNSTRISKRGLVEELEKVKSPPAWNSALLKYCSYVVLDENDKVEVGKWILELDSQLGVVIINSTHSTETLR